MRKLASQASGIVLVVALGTILGATPASAATGVGVVEVSDDGVTFARTYPGAIFDDITHLTPGGSQSETIYVRNAGTAAGYLRVTLRNVRYSDQHFGNALTMTTSTPGSTGSTAAISSTNPCQVTHEGTVVAPGAVVPVVATLALGNLSGTDGQGATISLGLRFTLSDTTPGTLPATNCDTTGTTVPVTPTSPDGPRGADSTGSLSGTLVTPAPNSTPTTAVTPGGGANNSLFPTSPVSFNLDPNTWRLYQEYLVLILVLAAIIGAGISWFAGRRSRKDTHDV